MILSEESHQAKGYSVPNDQRKDFNQDKKTPEFEVSERATVTINTFLRMHQLWEELLCN